MWQELADADLLYVPLAFSSANPAEIRTVFPTKVTEYALADVPILVHGPADCYTVQYAQRKQWAYTVCRSDPESVWEGIARVRSDTSLHKQLAGAARKIVEERRATEISKWLQMELGVIPPND